MVYHGSFEQQKPGNANKQAMPGPGFPIPLIQLFRLGLLAISALNKIWKCCQKDIDGGTQKGDNNSRGGRIEYVREFTFDQVAPKSSEKLLRMLAGVSFCHGRILLVILLKKCRTIYIMSNSKFQNKVSDRRHS